MIRFSSPWFLVALGPLVVAWYFAVSERRRTILRWLCITLVILALAQPMAPRRQIENNVIFLVDRSASVTRTVPEEEIQDAIRDLVRDHPDWTYGAIAFAEGAATASPLGELVLPIPATPLHDAGTDLGAAMALALASFPEHSPRQIVLASDGRFHDGHAAAIDAIQLAGIPVSILPVGGDLPRDVALVSIDAPGEVNVARPFRVEVHAISSGSGQATLAIYRNGELASASEVTLQVGENRWAFTDSLPGSGVFAYRAIVKHPGDPVPDNDAISTLIRTTDRPPVLLIDGSGLSVIPALLHVIGVSHVSSDRVPPLETLAGYRQLVLTGLALGDLSAAEVADLAVFVRDLGGGLLVVEGEDEVSGFRGGELESLLPISFTLPETGQEASQAIVFLLDRSASMQARVSGGARKIDILKEATAASLQVLAPESLVGILAFNREFEWLLPIQEIGDAAAAYEALRPLEATGGTDIYFPLVDAVDCLEAIEARSKHVLLVSDGRTVDEFRNYPSLLNRLRNQDDLSVSAIAVGLSPNLALLSALTQAGSGSLYHAQDFSTLPQVSIEATQRLTRSRFVTTPSAVTGQLGEVLSPGQLPPVDGHVVTHPKASAKILLWADEDPLLASWQVGLGSVAVLNTDLAGVWTSEWVEWPDAGALFGAILATIEPIHLSTLGLAPIIEVTGNRVSILIDARDADGAFADFLEMGAELLPTHEVVDIGQVAPGLYAVDVAPLDEGGYALRIVDRTRDRGTVVPFTVSYPEEYRTTGIDWRALAAIAERTGGRLLDGSSSLVAVAGKSSDVDVPLSPALLLAAIGVFLLELAARKLPRRSTLEPDRRRVSRD